MRNENAYAVDAAVRCGYDGRDRACKWMFWYDKAGRQWLEPRSLASSCVPVSSTGQAPRLRTTLRLAYAEIDPAL